ncbi:MAG: VanW family protein [Peptococcaceae bacterium]|nr:VanW family protein [Peptococcaceae bacterium]
MPSFSHSSQFVSRPKMRSAFRMAIGKSLFTLKRYLHWAKNWKNYAREHSSYLLPHIVSTHKTPLIRNLGKDSMPLQRNKITNFSLALPHLNKIVLHPGETFSFWLLVGKPTKKKGYIEGMVLHNGECRPGIGGGLCQISNLIYWMTLHAPLTVTERWRHNYDVFPDSERSQPFGSGATVVYNYVDLQIRNNTQDKYQLVLEMDETFLSGQWRSSSEQHFLYEIYECEHQILSHWWGGYTRKNTLRRKITDPDGNPVGDEFVCANEAIMMYEPLLT